MEGEEGPGIRDWGGAPAYERVQGLEEGHGRGSRSIAVGSSGTDGRSRGAELLAPGFGGLWIGRNLLLDHYGKWASPLCHRRRGFHPFAIMK